MNGGKERGRVFLRIVLSRAVFFGGEVGVMGKVGDGGLDLKIEGDFWVGIGVGVVAIFGGGLRGG